MRPANLALTPCWARPAATCSDSHGPDSRVSIPISTSGLGSCSFAQKPSAIPKAWAVRPSMGNSPATPRMPSVPKSCLAIYSLFVLIGRDFLELDPRGHHLVSFTANLWVPHIDCHAKFCIPHSRTQLQRIGLYGDDILDSAARP